MLKFIQRMEVEKSDLEGKIKKAVIALNNEDLNLDKTEAALLQEQLEAMRNYNRVLKARIEYEKKLHGE